MQEMVEERVRCYREQQLRLKRKLDKEKLEGIQACPNSTDKFYIRGNR